MTVLTEGAWLQIWEESERGWGIRPDGYYYYPSLEAAEQGTKRRVQEMRAEEAQQGYGFGHAPDCYSRPSGEPQFVPVTEEVAKEIAAKGYLYSEKPLLMKLVI